MADVLAYKCPCCGGALEFNSQSQKMACPYCGNEFDMATLASYDEALTSSQAEDQMNWQSETDDNWTTDEVSGMVTYSCKSCGGEIVGDETLGASSCPFCGNPVVMTGQFSGALRPDIVIPFQLDKEAAKAGLEKHLEGRRLLPKVFKSQNHIDEIKGVYIPFWLFDTDTDANIRYKATKVRHWSDADYDYTETEYYSVMRSGELGFDDVPVDGSSKIDNKLMESIEPFDTTQAVDFQTAYLAGYFANKYDETAEDCIPIANERIKRSTRDTFRATVKGYDSVNEEACSVSFKNARSRYALYPAWLLSTSWNGENFLFAMNGQTGKFVGNLPTDKGAYWKYWGIGAAIFAACFNLIAWLASGANFGASHIIIAVIAALLFGFIPVSIMKSGMTTVRHKAEAQNYVKADSLNLSVCEDLYLYREVDQRAKPKPVQSAGH